MTTVVRDGAHGLVDLGQRIRVASSGEDGGGNLSSADAAATPTTTATPAVPPLATIRANLDLLQRKHGDSLHSQSRRRSGGSVGLASPAATSAPSPSNAPTTPFGRNRPPATQETFPIPHASSSSSPLTTAGTDLPSPVVRGTRVSRRFGGVDLSEAGAVESLSLSNVQRLHDALRRQILDTMLIELDTPEEQFDRVVKRGFEELEAQKRRARDKEPEHQQRQQPQQQQRERKANEMAHSPPVRSPTRLVSPAAATVPASSSAASSLGPRRHSFTRADSLASPSSPMSPTSPPISSAAAVKRFSSSRTSSDASASSPSHGHGVALKPRLRVNVHAPPASQMSQELGSISPPHTHTGMHHHSQASKSSSTRSAIASTPSGSASRPPSTKSYVATLLSNRAARAASSPTEAQLLASHPAVQTLVNLLSPRGTPSSSKPPHAFAFDASPPPAAALRSHTPPRVSSPLYGGASGHRFDRLIVSHLAAAAGSSPSSASLTSSNPSSSPPASHTATRRDLAPPTHRRRVGSISPAGSARTTPAIGSPPSVTPGGSALTGTAASPLTTTPMWLVVSPTPSGAPSAVSSARASQVNTPVGGARSATRTPSGSGSSSTGHRRRRSYRLASPAASAVAMSNGHVPQSSPPPPPAYSMSHANAQLLYAFPASSSGASPGSDEANTPLHAGGGTYFYAIPASSSSSGATPMTPAGGVGSGSVSFSPSGFFLTPVDPNHSGGSQPPRPLSTSAAGNATTFDFRAAALDYHLPHLTGASTSTHAAASSATAAAAPFTTRHASLSPTTRVTSPPTRLSPQPPSMTRPQSESIPRRAHGVLVDSPHVVATPPRSKTAGNASISGPGTSTTRTPTSAARIKRIRGGSAGSGAPGVSSGVGAQSPPGIASPVIVSPPRLLRPEARPSRASRIGSAGPVLQVNNWTAPSNEAALDSSSVPALRLAVASPATHRSTNTSAPANGVRDVGGGLLTPDSASTTYRPLKSRSRAAAMSVASLKPGSMPSARTSASASSSTHGKYHAPGRAATTKTRAPTTANKTKTKMKSRSRFASTTGISSSSSASSSPALVAAASSATSLAPRASSKPSLRLDMPTIRTPTSAGGASFTAWADAMQAIAEGDESAAALLSARLGASGAAEWRGGRGSGGVGGGISRSAFSSPVFGVRSLSALVSPSLAPSLLAQQCESDEIEEEPHLLEAGLEHETIPMPPSCLLTRHHRLAPHFDSDASSSATEHDEVEEEEHLREDA